jgi:hypothetical protein
MRAQKKLSTKDTKSTKKITTTSQGFVRVFSCLSWTDEVLK